MQRFDIVVFGFTGYTGKYVFEEVYRQSKKENFTYAVAGRNESKIKKYLNESSTILKDENVNDTPYIIADVEVLESIQNMTKQALILLNCVGPYQIYGEMVVKSCIENGTHHLDISGEPLYLEQMQLNYHKEAQSKGVYVIGSSGFGSIAAEYGVKYMSDLFDGSINDVDLFIILKPEKDQKIQYGSFESVIHILDNKKELSDIRKKLLPKELPRPNYPKQKRPPLFYSDIVQSWCLPLPEFDKSVVNRSQYYLHYDKGLQPVQFANYVTSKSLIFAILTFVIATIFGFLCKFKWMRYLFLKYPSIFSFGIVSVEGTPREALERSKMEITLIGKGWNSKVSAVSKKPNRKIISSISGPEPGYISCSIFMVQAAITILKEHSIMPESGGVYTPLVAFYNTTYMERIQNNGIHFAKVSDTVIP